MRDEGCTVGKEFGVVLGWVVGLRSFLGFGLDMGGG